MNKTIGGIVGIVVIIMVALLVWLTVGRGNQSSMNMPSMPSQQSTAVKPQATNAINITNFSFSPAVVTVKVGTTVTWTNQDSTRHTVTKDGSTGPDSSSLTNGQTYSFTFSQTGTYPYHCSIHPDMHGSVTVTP